jgi:hypothetical protein
MSALEEFKVSPAVHPMLSLQKGNPVLCSLNGEGNPQDYEALEQYHIYEV